MTATYNIIRHKYGTSTNSMLAEIAAKSPHGTVIAVESQTAGRGQRGNSWEAESGRNITMSMLFRPKSVAPDAQFIISEIVSVTVVEFIKRHLPESAHVSIKWPNDIYVSDKKICGILIEHSLRAGRIEHSIAGIGLNVNQRKFQSDAPNPVSMIEFTGCELPLLPLTDELATMLARNFERFDKPEMHQQLHTLYIDRLWRYYSMHPYIDAASGKQFMARIVNVEPCGFIHLIDSEGTERVYAFKEVAFVL